MKVLRCLALWRGHYFLRGQTAAAISTTSKLPWESNDRRLCLSYHYWIFLGSRSRKLPASCPRGMGLSECTSATPLRLEECKEGAPRYIGILMGEIWHQPAVHNANDVLIFTCNLISCITKCGSLLCVKSSIRGYHDVEVFSAVHQQLSWASNHETHFPFIACP